MSKSLISPTTSTALAADMVTSTGGGNSSCEEEPTTRPTLSKKPKLITASAVRESLSRYRRPRRPEVRRRSHSKQIPAESSDGCVNEEEAAADEKAEVEKKILALQRIVPGGECLGVDKLFEEMAGYIQALQFQVKALRALTRFVEGLEKEKRKLGG